MLILTQLGFNVSANKGHDTGSLVDLLSVTAQAILEVFIICLVGYIGGRKGAIDAKTKRTLNKLNQSIFTPALLFGKVAFTLTPAKLGALWIVPVGFVVVSVVSALVAWGMGFIFRLSRSQRAFAIACATFMNSNSLPIALMQSLTYTVESLKWGTEDSRDAMLGRALSYLVLFSTLGIILRWSYGIKLLSTADDEVANDEEQAIVVNERDPSTTATTNQNGASNDASTPLLGDDGSQAGPNGINVHGNGKIRSPVKSSPRFSEGPVTVGRPPNIRKRALERRWTAIGSKGDIGDVEYFGRDLTPAERKRLLKQEFSNFRSFPNTPTRTPAASSYASSAAATESNGEVSDIEEEDEEEYEGVGRRDGTAPSRSKWQAKLRKNRRNCVAWVGNKVLRRLARFWRGFNNFMTAPLYAALLSLVVACIRPVQMALDHMVPLRNAIKSAGNCSVPITLIVLGSYFVENPDDTPPSSSRKSALKKQASTTSSLRQKFAELFNKKSEGGEDTKAKPGENRTVFVSVVSRMIVAPMVLIPILAVYTIKTHNIADDPVFIVTAVLVIGSAPAITLAQMTNAVGNSFERLISKTLFVSYVIVTFPSTIALVLLGLEIAKRQ